MYHYLIPPKNLLNLLNPSRGSLERQSQVPLKARFTLEKKNRKIFVFFIGACKAPVISGSGVQRQAPANTSFNSLHVPLYRLSVGEPEDDSMEVHPITTLVVY